MGEDAFPRQWGFYFAVFAILPKMLLSFSPVHNFVENLC
jgi:hypothetical protein